LSNNIARIPSLLLAIRISIVYHTKPCSHFAGLTSNGILVRKVRKETDRFVSKVIKRYLQLIFSICNNKRQQLRRVRIVLRPLNQIIRASVGIKMSNEVDKIIRQFSRPKNVEQIGQVCLFMKVRLMSSSAIQSKSRTAPRPGKVFVLLFTKINQFSEIRQRSIKTYSMPKYSGADSSL
jgi:hypothetical protein